MVIVYPPQQQVSSLHLVMAMILLLLTAYPYVFYYNSINCSVAAYSFEETILRHNSISKFDIIQGDDIFLSRSLSTRDVAKQLLHEKTNANQNNDLDAILQQEQHHNARKVHFFSLGRRYNLILNKPSHLVTDDFTVVTVDKEGRETIVPFKKDDIEVLDGYLDDDKQSKATASFSKKSEKLMTAQIKTGEETIIVEPSYLHKDNFISNSDNSNEPILPLQKIYDDTMIVYNLRDHKLFNLDDKTDEYLHGFNMRPPCATITTDEYKNNFTNNVTLDLHHQFKNVYETYKPQKDDKLRSTRTKKSIEYVTDQVRYKTRCTLHLVADYLFYTNVGKYDLQTTINYLLALINRVNQIYLPTKWETGEDDGEVITNIGFTVQNITIHQDFTRLSSGEKHYNMQEEKSWTAREYLDNFSRYSPARHYCLAHLLTFRQFDSPILGLAYVASGRYGTIGGICSPTQQKGDIYYKHNTGISTSKGITGETLITRQADLVVSHELGHNLGAEHDSNDCRPDPSNGGAYLMHPFAVMGFERNNRFLSKCSRLSIGRVIKRMASTCFVGVVDHVCGNGIVEDDEECDGGDVGQGHHDPCCDSNCRFTPGSQCSDRHSWCCSKCRIVTAGTPCKEAEEFNCKDKSICDGRSADCPAPPPIKDDTVCIGRGLCRSGDCIPFCEANELYSCLCNTKADACKLCCKTSINGTCVPYDDKGPKLPDGVLCYRGVCEKGRCEQPIQDVVERLWDVIEDINLTAIVRFMRDNIIFVVLVITIPIWYIVSQYINEFDKRVKEEVMNAIAKSAQRRKKGPPSPFLPSLFVGDELSNSTSADDIHSKEESVQPLKPPHAPQLGFVVRDTMQKYNGPSYSLETNL